MRMRNVPQNTVLLLCLLANACVSYSPAPLDPIARFNVRQAADLEAPEVRAALIASPAGAIGADQRWTLDQLTVAAWTLRPEVAQVRAEIEVAVREGQRAQVRPNPTLSANTEHFLGGVSPWTIALQLDWLLGEHGQRKIATQIALQQQQAVQVRLAEALWAIAHEVRAAWSDWCLAGERARVARDAVVGVQRGRDLIAARVTAGRQAEHDQALVEAQLATAEAELQFALSAMNDAQVVLAHAVGVTQTQFSIGWDQAPEIDVPVDVSAFAFDDLMHQAVIDRLDLHAVLYEYAAQEQQLRLEVRKQYPTVQLGPGFGWDRGEHKLLLGVGLSLPLFDRNQAGIAQAEAQRAAIAARFDTLQATARAAVDRAYAALTAALSEAIAFDRVAQERAQLTVRQQQLITAGRGDALTLNDARLAELAAKKNTLESNARLTSAVLELENAVQHPLWPASKLAATSFERKPVVN